MQIVKIDVKDLFFFHVSIEEQPKISKEEAQQIAVISSHCSQLDFSWLISDANLY